MLSWSIQVHEACLQNKGASLLRVGGGRNHSLHGHSTTIVKGKRKVDLKFTYEKSSFLAMFIVERSCFEEYSQQKGVYLLSQISLYLSKCGILLRKGDLDNSTFNSILIKWIFLHILLILFSLWHVYLGHLR